VSLGDEAAAGADGERTESVVLLGIQWGSRAVRRVSNCVSYREVWLETTLVSTHAAGLKWTEGN
jgi:hypothetical protein